MATCVPSRKVMRTGFETRKGRRGSRATPIFTSLDLDLLFVFYGYRPGPGIEARAPCLNMLSASSKRIIFIEVLTFGGRSRLMLMRFTA